MYYIWYLCNLYMFIMIIQIELCILFYLNKINMINCSYWITFKYHAFTWNIAFTQCEMFAFLILLYLAQYTMRIFDTCSLIREVCSRYTFIRISATHDSIGLTNKRSQQSRIFISLLISLHVLHCNKSRALILICTHDKWRSTIEITYRWLNINHKGTNMYWMRIWRFVFLRETAVPFEIPFMQLLKKTHKTFMNWNIVHKNPIFIIIICYWILVQVIAFSRVMSHDFHNSL